MARDMIREALSEAEDEADRLRQALLRIAEGEGSEGVAPVLRADWQREIAREALKARSEPTEDIWVLMVDGAGNMHSSCDTPLGWVATKAEAQAWKDAEGWKGHGYEGTYRRVSRYQP
jgi:hypothetical protein